MFWMICSYPCFSKTKQKRYRNDTSQLQDMFHVSAASREWVRVDSTTWFMGGLWLATILLPFSTARIIVPLADSFGIPEVGFLNYYDSNKIATG